MRPVKKMTIIRHSNSGFSLVEILLVVLIVGFIALLLGNIPSSLKLTGNSNHQSLAKQIATEQMDNLRLKTYANLANGTTNISDPRLSSLLASTGTITIADCAPPTCLSNEKAKTVNVYISWNEGSKNTNIQFDTLISEGGLK